MNKEYYNMEIHTECLLTMLEKEDPCGHCPKDFAKIPMHMMEFKKYVCDNICRPFVGLTGIRFDDSANMHDCPCFELGKEEALKRTWIALDEGGYIDG